MVQRIGGRYGYVKKIFKVVSNRLFKSQAHEAVYPNLAKMARDFLCVSGTGVPIERFFSNGPLLLAPNRRKMLPATIRNCLCLKGWLKSENNAELIKLTAAAVLDKMRGN